MESIYFLYNNYPYIIAAYGYYKCVNSSLNNINQGIQIINIAKRIIYPPKIKNNWIEVDIQENTQIIDLDKNTILINHSEGEWEIIQHFQKHYQNPSHTFHTFEDPLYHKDSFSNFSLHHSHSKRNPKNLHKDPSSSLPTLKEDVSM